jgi:hypothetical protein
MAERARPEEAEEVPVVTEHLHRADADDAYLHTVCRTCAWLEEQIGGDIRSATVMAYIRVMSIAATLP